MIPVETGYRRVMVRRNRSGFLLGMSWSHDPRWTPRRTHIYLGWWVATVHTRIPDYSGRSGGPDD